MATIKQLYGGNNAMTITLASLGSGSGRAATAIDNSTNLYMSADVFVKIKTGASGTSATGYISVYLVRSEDGTNYEDGFGGTDAALTPSGAQLLGSFPATANATTYSKVFDLQSLGITIPTKWSICVVNNSGAALDSTAGNHAVQYNGKQYQTA